MCAKVLTIAMSTDSVLSLEALLKEEDDLNNELHPYVSLLADLNSTSIKEKDPRWPRWRLSHVRINLQDALRQRHAMRNELQRRQNDVNDTIYTVAVYGYHLENLIIGKATTTNDEMFDRQLKIAETIIEVLELLSKRCVNYRRRLALADWDSVLLTGKNMVVERVDFLKRTLSAHRELGQVVENEARAMLENALSFPDMRRDRCIVMCQQLEFLCLPDDRSSKYCVQAFRACRVLAEFDGIILGSDFDIHLAFLDAALVSGHNTMHAAEADFDRLRFLLMHVSSPLSAQLADMDQEAELLMVDEDLPWYGRDVIRARSVAIRRIERALGIFRLSHMIVHEAREIRDEVEQLKADEKRMLEQRKQEARDVGHEKKMVKQRRSSRKTQAVFLDDAGKGQKQKCADSFRKANRKSRKTAKYA